MAYVSDNFSVVASTGNSETAWSFSYRNDSDTLAEILAAGYFDAAAHIEERDLILIAGSDLSGVAYFSSATSPVTTVLITGAESGDIVGPGSSTDNALVRWNGATGLVIANSNAILDDAGLLTVATLSVSGTSEFNNGMTVIKNNNSTPYILGKEEDDTMRWAIEKEGSNGLALNLYDNTNGTVTTRIRNGNGSFISGHLLVNYTARVASEEFGVSGPSLLQGNVDHRGDNVFKSSDGLTEYGTTQVPGSGTPWLETGYPILAQQYWQDMYVDTNMTANLTLTGEGPGRLYLVPTANRTVNLPSGGGFPTDKQTYEITNAGLFTILITATTGVGTIEIYLPPSNTRWVTYDAGTDLWLPVSGPLIDYQPFVGALTSSFSMDKNDRQIQMLTPDAGGYTVTLPSTLRTKDRKIEFYNRSTDFSFTVTGTPGGQWSVGPLESLILRNDDTTWFEVFPETDILQKSGTMTLAATGRRTYILG